ncbi:hypothetical protein NLI96_g10657 [Meripilus lineatus]|uniref:Zn(2)-C6 fungal-type domain-containing protein n=1 Tax=Meripilus lineatus TaxID=2056292 RepID=A0AAD5UTI4_9APHY|nr:hypothetical protein NLI96_g10657 [Physisporinus lineatus]
MSSNPKIPSNAFTFKVIVDKPEYKTGPPRKKPKVSCERCIRRGMSCTVPEARAACTNCRAVHSQCSLAAPRARSSGLANPGVQSASPTQEPLHTHSVPSTQASSADLGTTSLKRKREPAADATPTNADVVPTERQDQTDVPPSQNKVPTQPSGLVPNGVVVPNPAKTQTLAATTPAKSLEASETRPSVLTSTVARPTATLPNVGDNPRNSLRPQIGSLPTRTTEAKAKGAQRKEVETDSPRSTLKTFGGTKTAPKSLPQPPMHNITEKNVPPSTASQPSSSSVDAAASSTPASSRSHVKFAIPSKPSSSTSFPQKATASSDRTGGDPTSLRSTKTRMKEKVVTAMEEVVQEKLNALVEDMVDQCFLSIAQMLKETFEKP